MNEDVKILEEVVKYLLQVKPLDGDISKFVDEHFWELV